MTNNFTFLEREYLWPVLGCALAVWAVFLWKEWGNAHKGRFPINATVAFLSIVSLVLIVLKPAVARIVKAGKGAVITEGYAKERLDSLRKVYRNLPIVHYKNGEPMEKVVDSLDELFVLGHGLQPFDLWQLKGKSVTYLGGDKPRGIAKLKYPAHSTTGSKLIVEGLYHEPDAGHRLVLQEPGGAGLDSIVMEKTGNQEFRLETDLKVKGKYIYSLVEKGDKGNVLRSEPLPISVTEKSPLDILIVNDYPTFETKYLKNILAEKGHRVLVRSQITKNRYKFEYFNRVQATIEGLTEKTLERFDLLIMDAESYMGLSPKSFHTVSQAIRENGLGLIVQSNVDFYSLPSHRSHFGFARDQVEEIALDEWPKILMEKHPFVFDGDFLVRPLFSSNGRAIGAIKPFGNGRVALTLLKNTYQLVLNGHSEIYGRIWMGMIDGAAKRQDALAEWESDFPIGYQNRPFGFKLWTSDTLPKVMKNGGGRIPMAQDVDIPGLWTGTAFPRETGWNRFGIEGDTTVPYDYYVLDTMRWKTLDQYRIMDANKRWFIGESGEAENRKSGSPISPIWFYLIFLCGMGWLWAEPKLYGN